MAWSNLSPFTARKYLAGIVIGLAALAWSDQADAALTVELSDDFQSAIKESGGDAAAAAKRLNNDLNDGLRELGKTNADARALFDSGQKIRIVCYGSAEATKAGLVPKAGLMGDSPAETKGDFDAKGSPKPGGTTIIAVDCERIALKGLDKRLINIDPFSTGFQVLVHELLHASNDSHKHPPEQIAVYEAFVTDFLKALRTARAAGKAAGKTAAKDQLGQLPPEGAATEELAQASPGVLPGTLQVRTEGGSDVISLGVGPRVDIVFGQGLDGQISQQLLGGGGETVAFEGGSDTSVFVGVDVAVKVDLAAVGVLAPVGGLVPFVSLDGFAGAFGIGGETTERFQLDLVNLITPDTEVTAGGESFGWGLFVNLGGRIAESDSPLPRDRTFFSFNYFDLRAGVVQRNTPVDIVFTQDGGGGPLPPTELNLTDDSVNPAFGIGAGGIIDLFGLPALVSGNVTWILGSGSQTFEETDAFGNNVVVELQGDDTFMLGFSVTIPFGLGGGGGAELFSNEQGTITSPQPIDVSGRDLGATP